LEIADILLCPECEKPLKENDDTLECIACSNIIRCDLGTIALEDDQDYYWGEIPRSEMMHVLSLARDSGWRQSVDEIILTKYPHLRGMVLGEDRVDWISRTAKTNLTILDIGSGWGQTSFLLAENKMNTVVSLEKIKERALFQAIRKEQEIIDNMYVINGDIFTTAFSKVFDLVLFIGVFEWIGIEGQPKSPRDIQLNALRKAHSFLKDGGSICIGIENRIGFNNFLGAKDHSGLRFTSLMPRAMADLYMKFRKPSYRSNAKSNTYRTYTYSSSGYKTLLEEAGFKNVEALIAHPHYAHPRCLMEMSNPHIRQFFAKVYQPTSLKDALFSAIFQSLATMRVASLFAPHFIIFARK